MLEKVHDHLVSELGQSSRTDTIFVITAIAFNLIILAVNSGTASASGSGRASLGEDLIFFIFILVTLAINVIALTAIVLGRRSRVQLLQGLIDMYNDNDVAKYYSGKMLSTYGRRYDLFTAVIGVLGATAILVPLIIRFL